MLRADLRPRLVVRSASLVRWWFSGWKLHGQRVSFTNTESCRYNYLLTDLQSTHSNLHCSWYSREMCWCLLNYKYQQHWPKFCNNFMGMRKAHPCKATDFGGFLPSGAHNGFWGRGEHTLLYRCTNTHTLKPWTESFNIVKLIKYCIKYFKTICKTIKTSDTA